jgi:hypothetical protein
MPKCTMDGGGSLNTQLSESGRAIRHQGRSRGKERCTALLPRVIIHVS